MPKLLKALLALSVVSIAALVAGCGSGIKTTELTATAPTKSKPAIIDNGTQGASGGDITAFTSPLSIQGSNDHGTVEGVSITVPNGNGSDAERRLGSVQFTLPKGTILTSGMYVLDNPRDRQPSKQGVTRAITGGTGDYRSAGGEVTATPLSGGEIKFQFSIDIPS